jgi:FkbM family methyltransferase
MIYIDLGAYTGDTVTRFLDSHPGITQVWAFEPHPYPKEWEELRRTYPDLPIHLIPKAAWIRDEEIYFSVHINPHSHTVVSACINYADGETTTVDAIDFAAWLMALPGVGTERVIVKIDVEGAEYDILDRLIDTGAIRLIEDLYVEFHDWIMPAEYKQRHAQIVARCPIIIHGWE